MASLEGDEVISGENGNVTRRTRSGRAVKPSTVSPTKPGPKSRKAALNKPVFENTEDLKEMAKGLDAMFEQEEEQDEEGGDPEEGFVLPLGCERSPKSDSTANPTLGVGYGEESNGSMDAMLNTCFQENIISNDEDVEMPFESMDGSIADAATEAEGIPLDDSEFFIKCDSQVEAVEEEVMEEPKIQQEVNEEVQQEAKEEVEQEVKETVPEKKEVIEVAKKTEDDIGAEDISDSHVSASENEGMEGETEVVSEDELPVVEKPEVKDAENVSDDELPGPKPAELPADTEVVSEDELPSSKKESARESRKRKTKSDSTGYDPGSPTSENEGSTKKQAIAKDGESKPQPAEKRVSEEQTTKKKVLPELDKYWKAVNDEPTDFTAWTYLLQYVDQESDVEAAREAYDAFLSHYPYCYGYWRKYADYEKRKGSKKKCLEVLERGLRGVPMSVDLWIHFLNHAKTTRSEDQQYIRQQYERAVAACGLEFRSDRLWESYIKWETENGTPLQVTALYDRLLATPTLGYTTHFDNFQEHIMSHPAHLTVPVASFVQHRADVRSSSTKGSPLPDSDPDIPPGEEEADDHVRSEEEASSIKEKVIAVRRKIHKITIDQVAQRWNFEEGIKRPYFHVKPLERCQLKNWKAYLEWEEQRDDPTRTLVLYERCLIACALYEEFWLRLVQYLEGRIASLESEPDTEEERGRLTSRTRDVLERACTIHHLDKPALHLRWAFFEEAQGNACRACEILERLDKTCPNLLQVAYRRINLERRRGDFDKCSQLYESYISSTKSKMGASNMAVKFARFLLRWRSDLAGAIKVLRAAISKDPACQRLYLQMVDVALVGKEVDVTQVVGYLDEYLSVESIDSDSRLLFSQRKLELLEELSDRVQDIQAAQLQYQRLAKQHHKKKNKDKALPMGDPKKKDGNIPPLPANNAVSGAVTSGGAQGGYGGYGNTGAYSYGAPPPTQQPPYEAGAATGYPPQPYQAPWGQYQQPPNPYQQHTWPPYQNYY